MTNIKLKFKRNVTGFMGKLFNKGDVIDYSPWPHMFQGMTEPERIEKNIFVHCYGQGEFDLFTKDDVDPFFLEKEHINLSTGLISKALLNKIKSEMNV